MLGARTRAVIVALCSFLFPGLGQALLRRWIRALFFVGMFLVTVAVFAPDSIFTTEGGIDGALATAQQASEDISTLGNLALVVVQFGAMMDAYLQALRGRRSRTPTGPTCPRCSREIEPSHGFCHWCTYEFEDPPEKPPDRPQ